MGKIFKKELTTEIEIEADAARIWDIFTDFDRYPEWTGIFSFPRGHLEPGKKLEVVITPTDSRSVTFRPMLLKAEGRRELRWKGNLLLPGVFDGEHYFVIEEIAEMRVRFLHGEIFTGFLVPWFWRDLDTGTRSGFERFNRDLKKRVEEKV
jgi:hypothetical protein